MEGSDLSILETIGGTRVPLPAETSDVVTIDSAAECDPQAVGMHASDVERVWRAVTRLYRTGLHPSVTLVLRRQGRTVMKRSIGTIHGDQADPRDALHPDAPQCLFSASKVVSSLLIHKLVERGRLRLDDTVARYIPEFGCHGKESITLRDILAHRAGMPFIPREYADPELLHDWDRILEILCANEPRYPSVATQAYHALTGGFIAGEVVRRVGDIELREALQEWIAGPLGCRYLTYGADPVIRPQRAHDRVTGFAPPWPLSVYFQHLLSVPFETVVSASSEEPFLSSVVPAANIHASADDLGRVFEMLRRGGELDGTRVLEERTVREIVQPVGRRGRDRALQVPLRYSAGCMLGDNPVGLYGPFSAQAFGHIGFMNIMGWADPRRGISVGLLNTGKSIMPAGVLRIAAVVWAISRACRPVDDSGT